MSPVLPFSILPSLSLTVALYTSFLFLLPFYFIFPLLFFLHAEFCECVCVKGPSGLAYQLPLLLAPRAKESVLKCLRCRPGRSLFQPWQGWGP